MTDYRALCAELCATLEAKVVVKSLPLTYQECGPLLCRARAALAQPKPVAPTDEEIFDEATKSLYFSFAHMGDPNKWEGGDADLLDFARAVLARWGQP
jgi:hypothetical protein